MSSYNELEHFNDYDVYRIRFTAELFSICPMMRIPDWRECTTITITT